MAAKTREQGLNRAFVDLADSLVGEFEVADLAQWLVAVVADLLAADAAGILFRDERRDLQLMASSSTAAGLVGLYELQSGQGPSLDCFRTGRRVAIPDLDAVSDRWALFVPAAREQGYAAAHVVPMRVREQVVGALSLFSVDRGDPPEIDLDAAQALADVATIGILHERASHHEEAVVEETQEMLHSRAVIEQAKGMLAASGVGMDEAFDLLRHYARYRDSRMVEVATDLAAGRLQPSVIIDAGTLNPS